MNWGLIGAVAGAGEGIANTANTAFKETLDEQKQNSLQEAMMNRQQALETFKLQAIQSATDTAREKQAARWQTAKQGLIDAAQVPVNAQFDAAQDAYQKAADDGTVSADDLQAATGTIAANRAAALEKVKTGALSADNLTNAGLESGDLTVKDALSNTNKSEMAQMRWDSFAQRTEMMQKLQESKNETALAVKQMQLDAAKEKASNGKIDTATGHMLITSYDADIRASTSMLNMVNQQLSNLGKADPNRQALEAQADQHRAEVKAAQANKIGFFKSMGYPAGEFTEAPTPAGAKPAAASPSNFDYSAFDPGAKPKPAAVAPREIQAPPSQTFNEAGYDSVTSTIAGAGRGDAKAKSLLRQMLDEGGLTARDQAAIAKVI